MMKGSWRTSALGIVAIAIAVLGAIKAMLDGDPSTNVNWETTGSAISAGWAAIMARDNKVTSEEAGAAKK